MIISVPTVLNCFHRDAFSSSILTSSFGVLAAGSLGTGGGARSLWGRALVATSQAGGGYIGMWAGPCRSVGTHTKPRLNAGTSYKNIHLHAEKMERAESNLSWGWLTKTNKFECFYCIECIINVKWRKALVWKPFNSAKILQNIAGDVKSPIVGHFFFF